MEGQVCRLVSYKLAVSGSDGFIEVLCQAFLWVGVEAEKSIAVCVCGDDCYCLDMLDCFIEG